jgi:hypothetical protein
MLAFGLASGARRARRDCLVGTVDGEARFRNLDRESGTRGMCATKIAGIAANDRNVGLRFGVVAEAEQPLHAASPG